MRGRDTSASNQGAPAGGVVLVLRREQLWHDVSVRGGHWQTQQSADGRMKVRQLHRVSPHGHGDVGAHADEEAGRNVLACADVLLRPSTTPIFGDRVGRLLRAAAYASVPVGISLLHVTKGRVTHPPAPLQEGVGSLDDAITGAPVRSSRW